MSLFNEIMNIKVDGEKREATCDNPDFDQYDIYNRAHRDARHDAAGVVLGYETLIERLLNALDNHNAVDFVDDIRAEYNL